MKFLAAVLSSLTLVACGGGGDTVSPNLTISGTAATGKAIASALVNAKCQIGTATATTAVDGSYSILVPGGKLPCALEIVNPVTGTKLHTLAVGDGSFAVANITPLTEMLTGRVVGSEPAAFFATFDGAGAASKVTPTAVKTAQADVAAAVSGAVDTSAVGDFVSTPLHAANANNLTGGDAQDKMLDTLGASISNAQFTQMVSALAHSASTNDVKRMITKQSGVQPIANAGPDQNVAVGTVVSLDGSASSIDSKRKLKFTWTLTTKPATSSAVLSSSTSVKTTFTVDVAGTYVASLIVNDGQVYSGSDAVSISVSMPPTVTSVATLLGPAGQNVYVYGTNFVVDQTTISMGGLTLIPALVTANFSLQFIVPAGATGSTPITVVTPYGSAASSEIFTVGTPTGTPTVTSIATTLGPVGQWVYVYGTNFVFGQTTVSMGGMTLIPTAVGGPTSLGFAVPVGATGSSPITVVTPYGSAASSEIFTVGIPGGTPTLTSFSPGSGAVGQWTYVYGSNFVFDQTTISMGGLTSIPAYVYSPTSLGFAVPIGASGTGPITVVVTPNGSATSTDSFAVISP